MKKKTETKIKNVTKGRRKLEKRWEKIERKFYVKKKYDAPEIKKNIMHTQKPFHKRATLYEN